MSDYPERSAAIPDYPDMLAGSSLILLSSLLEGLDKHAFLPADFLEHGGGFPGAVPSEVLSLNASR